MSNESSETKSDVGFALPNAAKLRVLRCVAIRFSPAESSVSWIIRPRLLDGQLLLI